MSNWQKRLILALILLLALCLSACGSKDIAESYSEAQQLLAEGNYAQSAAAFEALGSYEEASRLGMYAQAHAEAEKGNYALAASSMSALGDFRDASLQAVYYKAQYLLQKAPKMTSLYQDAEELLGQLGVFRKSHEVSVKEVAYKDGLRLLENSDFSGSAYVFRYLRSYDYKDSTQLYGYALARGDEDASAWVAAIDGYAELGSFRDSAQRLTKCADAAYQALQASVDAGLLKQARTQLKQILNHDHFSRFTDLPQLNDYLTARELEATCGTDVALYTRVVAMYAELGDFRDSVQRVQAIPQRIYDNAMAALDKGDYKTASTLFNHQPDYLDSLTMVAYTEARRLQSVAVSERDQLKKQVELDKATWNDVDELWAASKDANQAFAALGEFRDSAARASSSLNLLYDYTVELGQKQKYVLAGNILSVAKEQPEWIAQSYYFYAQYYLAEAEKTDSAAGLRDAHLYFRKAGTLSDAAAQAEACVDKIRAIGDAALAADDYKGAASAYNHLPDAKEASSLSNYANKRKTEADGATDPQKYALAADAYEQAPDVRDSAERAAACRKTLFQMAETAYAEGRYNDAATLYGYQPDYQEGKKHSAYASAMAMEVAASAVPAPYAAAADAYETLGDFSDAAQRAADCRETLFQMAETALTEGRYTVAASLYSSQPSYKMADKQVEYTSARALESGGKSDVQSYLKAADAYDAMDGFRDTADRAEACRKAYYDYAAALVVASKYAVAAEYLVNLGEYSDAPELCKYSNARALMSKQKYEQALPLLTELGDYRDAATQLGQVQDTLYNKAVSLFNSSKYTTAANTFRLLGDYKDAAAFASYSDGVEAEIAWLAGNFVRLADAQTAFAAAAGFRDADDRLRNVTGYADGLAKLEAGEIAAAATAFAQVSGYQQADVLVSRCNALNQVKGAAQDTLATYGSALINEVKGDAGDVNGYIAAADLYESLGKFQDASQRAVKLRNKLNILFADKVRTESEGLRAVLRNGKWGFANAKDELISDFQWDDCKDFSEGFAAVKKDGKWGFIRANGTVLCKPTYNTVYSFREGRARVFNGSYYNYLKSDGKSLFSSSSYKKATDFSQGRAMVFYDSWDDEWRIIDLNGKTLLSKYITVNSNRYYIKESSQFANGFAKITVNTSSYSSYGNKTVYINLACEYVSDTAPVAEGKYWKISYNGKDAYMNQQGTIVTYASTLSFNAEGYCLTNNGSGSKGMIHKDGRTITGNTWNDIHHFSGNRALVKKGNYYGFIGRDGKTAIECKYNNAHDFSDGLALVKLNGMCGFINEKGDVVVPLIYDDATDFENGQARVQRYGQWTVIDTSGKPVK